MSHEIRIQRPEQDPKWKAAWGTGEDAANQLSMLFYCELHDYERHDGSYFDENMRSVFGKLFHVVHKDYPCRASILGSTPIAGQHVDLTTEYKFDTEERADNRHKIIIARLQPFIDRAIELGMTVDTGVAIFVDEKTRHQSRMEGARDNNLLLAEKTQFEIRERYEEKLRVAARGRNPYLSDYLEEYEMMRDRHLITLAEIDERKLSPAREQQAKEDLARLNEGELKSQATETRSRIKADRLPGESPSVESDMLQRHLGFIASAQEALRNPLPATIDQPRFSRLLPGNVFP